MLPPKLTRLFAGNTFLPLLMLMIGIAVTEAGVWEERGRINADQRQQALTSAAAMRAALESELNANLHLASGMAAYLRNAPGKPEQIRSILADLYEQGRHLRNFVVAPGNRITYVHPYEGNEKALGVYYPDLPKQWPVIARTIERREASLAGPVDLVQGGVGLIYRRPVFLADGSYWGIISSVIDVDHLFGAVLAPFMDKGTQVALRGRDGMGAQGEVFRGDAALFAHPDAALMTIDVPGGQWQLAVMLPPAPGLAYHLGALRSVGYGLTLLMAFLVWHATRAHRQRRRLAETVSHMDEKLRSLYKLSPLGIAMTDMEGHYREFNEAFRRITGYDDDELRELRYQQLTPEQYRQQDAERMEVLERTGRYDPYEKEYVRRDGSRVPIRLSSVLVTSEDGSRNVWSIVEDISAQRAAEDRIRTLAYFDPLTNLPNRRLLQDRLGHALANRSPLRGALLFIDLDNFKALNDTRGHAIGDMLLETAAARLVSCVREGDTVARLGGDEFVVLLESLSEDEIMAASLAEAVAEKIRQRLGEPYPLDANNRYHGSASIGIASFGAHESSVENLLRQADVALYQAKDSGRNAIRFYNAETQAAIDARVAMEAGLRKALALSEFKLYYQPQVDDTGSVIGAEALIRWHNGADLVPPDRFIPVAEDTGMILPIGQWVLEQACAELLQWKEDPLRCRWQLAVNVSPRQFRQPNFVDLVRDALAGADPQQLKLELTESLVLDDVEDAIVKMRMLRELGVSFALDDFGTGYSSLAYLRRLPLDQIKIDRSFVSDAAEDGENVGIILAIISMSRSLGLQVIAEGVETQAQRDFLARNGCNAYQGYLFGRPMPLSAFDAWASAL